jgi:Fe-S-cluster-containing dehydrogenase component
MTRNSINKGKNYYPYMNRYKLLVDNYSCWGCKACEVACKQENGVPLGLKLISVEEEGPMMRDGRMDFTYRVRVCRHCETPACLEVCPVEAIEQRSDGLVILDSASCTGCTACLEACPYQAITWDDTAGRARKCNLCVHRVDQGLLPACADNICLAHGIFFGPEEQINKEFQEKTWLKDRLVEDRKKR